MGRFGRSWEITKLTFGVIGKDKEMLLFPLIGSIASLLYIAAILYPAGVLDLLQQGDEAHLDVGVVQYLLLFVLYFGLAFIATFFNVCVVYTTKIRFAGGDATFGESIGYGLKKLPIIVQWALVSAVFGLLMAFLERLAERMGGAGEIVLNIVRGLVGMVWSIVTLFVIPTLVYEDVGPKEAIKRSTEVIKRTWGESLIRHFTLGLVQFGAVLLVIGFAALLWTILPGMAGMIAAFVVGVVGTMMVILVFNVANTVFNTALYVYGTTGQEPGEFAKETLDGAFRTR